MDALLASLGNTPDEVAQTMKAEGCYGPPNNDCFCPIARFLTARTGQAASATSHVCVLGEFVYDDDGEIQSFVGREWVRTPSVVGQFIDAFDSGNYDYLHPRT